jgi:hypothetical protein
MEKDLMRSYLLLLLCVLGVNCAFAEDPNSPLGNWKTVDDVTGLVLATIHIEELPNHTLSGTLIKTFQLNPKAPPSVCSKCAKDDPRYNKPILGMTIMTGFHHVEGNVWGEGEIVDPKRGSIYRSQVRTVDNGKKLSVRGFVGLPLFGRTQTWIRDTA